jgi:Ca2+-transporting ATPase
MAAVTIAGFGYAYFRQGAASAQAMAFYITTFAQLFFAFSCRSQRYTLPTLGVFTNPYLLAAIVLSGLLQLSLFWIPLARHVFFAAPRQFGLDWVVMFVLALAPVSIVEIGKIVQTAAHRRNQNVSNVK